MGLTKPGQKKTAAPSSAPVVPKNIADKPEGFGGPGDTSRLLRRGAPAPQDVTLTPEGAAQIRAEMQSFIASETSRLAELGRTVELETAKLEALRKTVEAEATALAELRRNVETGADPGASKE